jgi:ribose-phosphate pyrophosphokinase
MTVIGDVKGRSCVLIDDICDTAGTLIKAAELLKDHGATDVHAYITHGVLSGPAIERVTGSALENLVITDSIEPTPEVKAAKNIRVVSVAPLFAQAVLNVGNDTSVSSLFHEDTLGPIYEAFYRLD